jgi:hypothetical protein
MLAERAQQPNTDNLAGGQAEAGATSSVTVAAELRREASGDGQTGVRATAPATTPPGPAERTIGSNMADAQTGMSVPVTPQRGAPNNGTADAVIAIMSCK